MIEKINARRLPKHIAIIMDGNGRWAKKRMLPRVVGHKSGMDSLKEIVTACSDLGIKILTVYAFSTENWNRPSEEVSFLMKLLLQYMRKEKDNLHKNNVKIKILGDIDPLPHETQKEIHEAIQMTSNNNGLQFNIALNYGGRNEIIRACKKIAYDIKNDIITTEDITEDYFSSLLYTDRDKDPDLLIRTSGEQRISNFLLWQGAYSEFVFTEKLWPDFKKDDLLEAIYEYQLRDRRFGAVK